MISLDVIVHGRPALLRRAPGSIPCIEIDGRVVGPVTAGVVKVRGLDNLTGEQLQLTEAASSEGFKIEAS